MYLLHMLTFQLNTGKFIFLILEQYVCTIKATIVMKYELRTTYSCTNNEWVFSNISNP